MVAEMGISNGGMLLNPWVVPTWLPLKGAMNSRTTGVYKEVMLAYILLIMLPCQCLCSLAVECFGSDQTDSAIPLPPPYYCNTCNLQYPN